MHIHPIRTVTVFIVTSVSLLLVFIILSMPYIFSHPVTTPARLNPSITLYPTNIFTGKAEWLDDKKLAVQDRNSIVLYDIDDRNDRQIYLAKGALVDFLPVSQDQILIVTTENLSITVSLYSISKTEEHVLFTSANSDSHITLGRKHICMTDIQDILHPTDIATTIKRFPLASESVEELFTTSLTVIPLTCTDNMILSSAFPLQPHMYIWSSPTAQPRLIPEAQADDIGGYALQSQVFGIQRKKTITLYRPEDWTASATISIEHPDNPWGIIDQETIATFDHEKEVFAISSEDHSKEYRLPEAGTSFTAITPNQYGSAYSCISSNGSLWILQL
jgi:hypothetical protein